MWPFLDTLWICSTAYLGRCFDGLPDRGGEEDRVYWGNAAMFAVHRYHHVALLWQVRKRTEGEPKVTFAQDVCGSNIAERPRKVTRANYPHLSNLDEYHSYIGHATDLYYEHDAFFENDPQIGPRS